VGILELAKRAASLIPPETSGGKQSEYPRLHVSETHTAAIKPRRYELNETNEITPAPPLARLFVGWVRARQWGWQQVISPRRELWAAEDLQQYVETLGEAVLDSIVLPDGEKP
jgi:hypothetical protein